MLKFPETGMKKAGFRETGLSILLGKVATLQQRAEQKRMIYSRGLS